MYDFYAVCTMRCYVFHLSDSRQFSRMELIVDLFCDMRGLDLEGVRGSERNGNELKCHLESIHLADYAGLRLGCPSHGRRESLSPDRTSLGAEWFHCNHWDRPIAIRTENQAYCATNYRPIPDGRTRGRNHSAISDWWAPNPIEVVRNTNTEALDVDVSFEAN